MKDTSLSTALARLKDLIDQENRGYRVVFYHDEVVLEKETSDGWEPALIQMTMQDFCSVISGYTIRALEN